MEEKERYKLESYNEAFCQIHDTESDEWYLRKDLVKDLLNQQDQKIKELKQQLAEKEKEIEYQESMKILAVKNQNETAIRELEKVKEWMNKSDDDGYIFRFASMDTREKFNQKLDQQIKELKGEK